MATIQPKSQEWFDFGDAARCVIGIHTLKLQSSSDTFRVPALAEPHATGSVKQLERAGDPTLTSVQASDADSDGNYNTITLAGIAGSEVIVATLHQGKLNFIEDEDS